MSQPSDVLAKQFRSFIDTLETRGMKFARAGAYSRASEFLVAGEALEKWVEEELDGAMDSISEENYERAYRPE